MKRFLVSMSLVLAGVSSANAATIDVTRIANNPHESVYGLRAATGTDGRDLDGAVITAVYEDGTSEVITWEAVDYDRTLDGFADGEGVDLFMNYDALEVTANRRMSSLSFDLTGATTVFDSAYGLFPFPDPNSTPGSSFGGAFVFAQGGDGLLGTLGVEYSGIVNLAGAAAAGDLFTTMTLDFTGLLPGGFEGFFSFYSDMDTMEVAGDLVPQLTPVPLTSSMSFLLLGLAGLGLGARRRRQHA